MDLNDYLNSHKNHYKKRQSIYLDCLFLCLYFLFLSLIIVSKSSFAQCQKLPFSEKVSYQYIYDGDTILLKDGRKIRLIGINTPEIARKGKASQPYAKKAKEQLRKILSASEYLYLSYDEHKKDKYQRTLAYIYLADGTDVQAKMLSSGLAISIVIPPNEKNLVCYRLLEQKARNKYKGIWKQRLLKEISAKKLNKSSRNYRFVRGRVTSVKERAKMITIQLDNNLSIKLSGDAFLINKDKILLGIPLQVRGIIYPYRRKSGMHINHPANIALKY